MRKLIPIYAILTALTLIVSASCNSSGNGDNEPTVVSANTLVSNFRLQKNDSVMTLLDSIPFTIDVNRRLIYNPDSLPKGTDITRLVASISLASSTSVGEISISGATTMKDTTYTYNASATDSIDFTGRVTLTVKGERLALLEQDVATQPTGRAYQPRNGKSRGMRRHHILPRG